MTEPPLVSILVNNFNYDRFLSEAIDSALAQTYSPVEVIVVDDGSTDRSRDIIRSYGDRITPVLKENGGQGSSFNAGFAASRGQIICFLDADDRFFPEKVRRVVESFDRHPQAGWCFHALRLLDTKTNRRMPSAEQQETALIDARQQISRAKMPAFAPATSAISFRRDLLSRLLPMPEVEGTSADRYLKIAGIGLSPGFYLNEDLAEQKIHGANAYTLRPDRQRVGAKSLVLCAHWTRDRFPELSRCTNKMFAMGLGIYRRTGGVDDKYLGVVNQYLSGSSIVERCGIRARTLYHSQPWMHRVRAAFRKNVAGTNGSPVMQPPSAAATPAK